MLTGGPVAQFTLEIPSVSSYWRAIILFGRNVASYKFALGDALLELGVDREAIPLEELALPFARRVADHLRHHDKQGTVPNSSFLNACRAFNRGELTEEALRSAATRLGFQNVIDAFHVVDNAEFAQRFFIDERNISKGIRLTDEMRALARSVESPNLREEVESRWRLVETAWELNLPRNVLTVGFEDVGDTLVEPRRRKPITGARGALNGYQKGRCFYCFAAISVASGAPDICHVDHVFPWSVGHRLGGAPVDGVWNLVLACARCNDWHEKSNRPPHERYVERLHRRNEFLISSNHPLRPTLIAQTGGSEAVRAVTLRKALDETTVSGARATWTAPEELAPAF